MGSRSLSIRLSLVLLIGAILTPSAGAVIQPQKPRPYRIWVSIEEERDDQYLESIRKLRLQEDRLGQFLDRLRAQGVDMNDPQIILIYRELRDLRRRIWRLERERFR